MRLSTPPPMAASCLSRSTWRQLCGGRNGSLCPPRYASIRAVGDLTLVGSSAHYGIRLFGLLRRRCDLLSGLPGRVEQVRIAQSPSEIRSAFGQQRPWPSATVGSSRRSLALPSPPPCSVCSIAALLLGRLLPLLAPMRVVERIVGLPANPQVVQKHRELPRHGHRRPLLCVLGSPRSYLLSVAPKVRVGTEGAEDVVGVAHQKLPERLVPLLGDALLGILASGLIPCGHES